MIFLVSIFSLVIIVIIILRFRKRKSVGKDGGEVEKMEVEEDIRLKVLVVPSITSLQISWKYEADGYISRLVKFENFQPLRLELKYPTHYVVPSLIQSSYVGRLEDVDENTKFKPDIFERIVFQPFYHSTLEKLCGVVRFNDRCCGPSKINDNLPFDCINGGATLSFGIEVMKYLSKLIEENHKMGRDIPYIEFNLENFVKKLEEVEIAYIKPAPLNQTYRFECTKVSGNGSDRFEVSISDFGLGRRNDKFVMIRGTIFTGQIDNLGNEPSSYHEENYKSFSDNLFPDYISDEIKTFENDENNEFIKLSFYDNNFPKRSMKCKSGINVCLPKYFLASKGHPHLTGDTNLLKFKYVNARPYFNRVKNETVCIVYFGEETCDYNQMVHQGMISTLLDNYAYLHCAKSVPINFASYTKLLKVKFFAEHEIRRFEFLKLVFKYEKEKEVSMGRRKAIYGNVTGMLCSMDEKKIFAEIESVWTSIQSV